MSLIDIYIVKIQLINSIDRYRSYIKTWNIIIPLMKNQDATWKSCVNKFYTLEVINTTLELFRLESFKKCKEY